MMAIPVAVIGCGHLGTFHARTYAANPRCRLVTVVDVDPERAARLAAELGCEAESNCANLQGRVRAASLATPTTTHEAIARELLAAGIDVLVEKPIAPDGEAGARMVAAARSAGRILAVGQIERCNPAFVCARRDLMKPRFIESHRLSTFVPRSLDVDVVLDLMIHDIDLVLSLATSPLEAVDAVGVPVITAEADIANARLRFADGSVANLTASRVSGQRMRKIRFFERNLYLSVDLAGRKVERVRLIPLEPSTATDEALPPEAALLAARGLRLDRAVLDATEGDALATEVEAFLAACAGEGAPVVDGEGGVRSLEVALRVREAVCASLERLGAAAPR
jgi:predicted dehydrogenase